MIDSFGRPVLVGLLGAAKLDLPQEPIRQQHRPVQGSDYAPIEQQVPSDERPEGYYTDIFALAGTMYRLLAGKPPIRAVVRSLASKDPYVPLAQASKAQVLTCAVGRGDRSWACSRRQCSVPRRSRSSCACWAGGETPPALASTPEPAPPLEVLPLLVPPTLVSSPATQLDAAPEAPEQSPSPEQGPPTEPALTEPAPRPSKWRLICRRRVVSGRHLLPAH